MPFDPEKQYDLYEILRKAEAGDRDAMLEAVNLMAVENLPWDDKTGDIREKYVRYLEVLAKEGCTDPDGKTDSQIMLADVYAKGELVARDTLSAIRLYELAAADGAIVANEFIGDLYYEGRGVPQNYKKAHTYYTKNDKRIKKGNHTLSTWYRLGEMYRLGLGIKKNMDKAVECYGKAFDTLNGYPDYFQYPCVFRHDQIVVMEHYQIHERKELEDICHDLREIQNHFKENPDGLKRTDITIEEINKVVEEAEKQLREFPEEGEFHSFECKPPITLEEFHENVQDVIMDLEDKDGECLVVTLRGRRKDRITCIQTYLNHNFTYHVEVLRNTGRKKTDWQCLTPSHYLTMEETVEVFKALLVENRTPDLTSWQDMTEKAKKTVS